MGIWKHDGECLWFYDRHLVPINPNTPRENIEDILDIFYWDNNLKSRYNTIGKHN